MKHIPEERLSTIGKLIGVIREEKRDKSQNKYTMKSFVDGVCTVNTLKRIEAGEIARIEEVYVELLDKLNLKLGYFPAVDEAILELMDPLYEAIEYYRVEDISKYCDMSLRVLTKVKDYAYYSEIYDLFLATKEYFEETKIISLQKMERFRNEYMLFDEKYHSLFKIMVFYRANGEFYNNANIFHNLLIELGFFKANNTTLKILSLNYLMLFGKFVSLKDTALELEKVLVKNNNYNRLLDVYSYLIYTLIIIEFNSSREYMNRANSILELPEVSKVKKMDFICNVAAALHENGMYEEALEYYYKMIEISDEDDMLLQPLICMAHCQRVLGLEVDIPKLKQEQQNSSNGFVQKIYRYFIEKDIKTFAKINFILKEVAPNISDKLIKKIFNDELILLVKQTGTYKSLYLYDEIVKNRNDIFLEKNTLIK